MEKNEHLRLLSSLLTTASGGLIECAGKSLEALQRLENIDTDIIRIYSKMCDYPGALELIDALADTHEYVKKKDAENDL